MSANRSTARKKASNDENLLDVEQAIKRLNIGQTKFYALMKSGELPYLDFGRRCRRFDPADLKTWLAKRKKNQQAFA